MSVRSEEPHPAASGDDVLPEPPAAAVKMLGSMLRALRLENDMGLKAAADIVRGSPSKVSRLERGESPPKHRDVFDLLRAYGVRDAETLEVVEDLLRRANRRPWWYQYADVTPGWLRRLIDLEESASVINTWEVHVVPGLVQTEDYARAVIANGLPQAPASEIERRVEMRLRRREVLEAGLRDKALVAVLDESVLARPVGGAAVMVGQLRHLLQEIERHRIQVRIVRFEKAASLVPPSNMTQLKFACGGLAELFYLEQHESATYLSGTAEVERYRSLLENLFRAAESRSRSKHMIEHALTVYENAVRA